MAKIGGTETFSANLINTGTIIKGNIECQGDIRFDGILTGNLSTRGKLVIGPNGDIKGDIICANSDIEGNVEGKINVAELLSFKSTARFIGDIITGRLAIEPGAIFSGTCSMKDRSPVQPAEQPKKKD